MGKHQKSSHESYDRLEETHGSSDRAFCYTFAVIGLILAGISLWRGGNAWPWLAGGAGVFALGGLLIPQLFAPLNRIWFKFGMMLHRITTPLIMGAVFFLAITPMGLLMRLFGKRPLRLKFDPEAKSYWIERRPPGPEPQSIKNQF